MRVRPAGAVAAIFLLVTVVMIIYHISSSREKPDVLLITIDTLRADRLRIYGGEGVETPNIDRLAAEGVVWERAVAPMPLTLPSHFSIFTSKYPREHGVMNHGIPLPEAELTLAEIFHANGYRTGGFVGVSLLGPNSGTTQGFEEFDHPRKGFQRPASQVVPKALEWLASLGQDERFFLWVHLFDPHLPYAPPPPFSKKAMDKSKGRFASLHWPQFLRAANRNGGDVPLAILDNAKALYDGEIELTDRWIGRLVNAVKKQRTWENIIVILTADHGECFENGVFFEHADCLYEGALHVPFVMLYPERTHAGRRVAALASLVDVAPTVLSAAGMPRPRGYSGRVIDVDVSGSEDRAVLIQYPFYQQQNVGRRQERLAQILSVAGEPTQKIHIQGEKVGIVVRDWKYVRSRDSEELFRLLPMPDEKVNLASREVEIRNMMRNRLKQSLARHRLNLLAPEELTDELQEALQALGYL